jgi:hypothetical protein
MRGFHQTILAGRNHGARRAVACGMELEPVTSSVIAAIGYDPKCQWLGVELKTGNLYLYREVPAHIHRAFMAAFSKGSFYNQRIRDDYPFVRVR